MTPASALTLLLAEAIEALVVRRVAEKTGAPFPAAHAGPSLVALLIEMAADARVYPDRDGAELWRGHADAVARRIYEPWRARFETLCAAPETLARADVTTRDPRE